jgi:hypothetical protein
MFFSENFATDVFFNKNKNNKKQNEKIIKSSMVIP